MEITHYNTLIGKTFVSVETPEDKWGAKEEMIFTDTHGRVHKFLHHQDCCETVTINDIIGDLSDLVGSPLLEAEEIVYNNENPEGVESFESWESFTWTFYKFATIKGSVTIRWLGESNGYYSESVDFISGDN